MHGRNVKNSIGNRRREFYRLSEFETSCLSSVRRLLTFDQGLIYHRCYKPCDPILFRTSAEPLVVPTRTYPEPTARVLQPKSQRGRLSHRRKSRDINGNRLNSTFESTDINVEEDFRNSESSDFKSRLSPFVETEPIGREKPTAEARTKSPKSP